MDFIKKLAILIAYTDFADENNSFFYLYFHSIEFDQSINDGSTSRDSIKSSLLTVRCRFLAKFFFALLRLSSWLSGSTYNRVYHAFLHQLSNSQCVAKSLIIHDCTLVNLRQPIIGRAGNSYAVTP